MTSCKLQQNGATEEDKHDTAVTANTSVGLLDNYVLERLPPLQKSSKGVTQIPRMYNLVGYMQSNSMVCPLTVMSRIS